MNLEFGLYILCTGMCVKEGLQGWGRSCKRLREEELNKILGVPKGGGSGRTVRILGKWEI